MPSQIVLIATVFLPLLVAGYCIEFMFVSTSEQNVSHEMCMYKYGRNKAININVIFP